MKQTMRIGNISVMQKYPVRPGTTYVDSRRRRPFSDNNDNASDEESTESRQGEE